MKSRLTQAAKPLLERFRRQTPLRAGSLLVTLFGDCILPRGGRIALGSLIRLAAPFGLNERLVRTAAARLVHEGWLETRRMRKLSEYHVSADGRERFMEATSRIYAAPDAAWPGRWTLAVLPALPAALRKRLRQELIWLGFGEFAAGVFAHPELPAATLKQLRGTPHGAELFVFDASLKSDDAPARLASLGWNLSELHDRYRGFVQRFLPVQRALAGDERADCEAAFVIRTLLIHEYRKLHLRDPLLPSRLLPDNWAGRAAADQCRIIYAGLFERSESYLTDTAMTLDGGVPAPSAEVYTRFGGLGLKGT
jgi:phenylacetic acid degradation operon negative regulatory protein